MNTLVVTSCVRHSQQNTSLVPRNSVHTQEQLYLTVRQNHDLRYVGNVMCNRWEGDRVGRRWLEPTTYAISDRATSFKNKPPRHLPTQTPPQEGRRLAVRRSPIQATSFEPPSRSRLSQFSSTGLDEFPQLVGVMLKVASSYQYGSRLAMHDTSKSTQHHAGPVA